MGKGRSWYFWVLVALSIALAPALFMATMWLFYQGVGGFGLGDGGGLFAVIAAVVASVVALIGSGTAIFVIVVITGSKPADPAVDESEALRRFTWVLLTFLVALGVFYAAYRLG